jgi:hypothetical protein
VRGHILFAMDDDLDLAEAAAYILGERPELDEDQVWAVLNEFGDPPPASSDELALQLVRSALPEVPPRTAQRILGEWRAYASLAGEPDWDDED